MFGRDGVCEGGGVKEGEVGGKDWVVVMGGCRMEMGWCEREGVVWGRML